MQCLWFLLPLLIVYTVGTVVYAPEGGDRLPAIYAERLLGRFFELFGATGYFLPPLLVLGVLVGMHAARPAGDPVSPEWKLWPWMVVESILYAIPLFLLGSLFSDAERAALWQLLAAAPGEASLPGASLPGAAILAGHPRAAGFVFALGAGIYEELVFRLFGIAAVHSVLTGLGRLADAPALWGAIGITGVAFALYHFGDATAFTWPRFLFYALAGVYLGTVFAGRGFGVAVATHAAYDVLAVAAA